MTDWRAFTVRFTPRSNARTFCTADNHANRDYGDKAVNAVNYDSGNCDISELIGVLSKVKPRRLTKFIELWHATKGSKFSGMYLQTFLQWNFLRFASSNC